VKQSNEKFLPILTATEKDFLGLLFRKTKTKSKQPKDKETEAKRNQQKKLF
jgi:hypothetical protein